MLWLLDFESSGVVLVWVLCGAVVLSDVDVLDIVVVVLRRRVVGCKVVATLDFGNKESTTPIGPSKSISDSGHVSSSD